MKKIPLLLFLLFSITFSSLAQDEKEAIEARNNIIKVNLSSFLLKTGCVQYERIISNHFTLTANVIYRPKSSFSPVFIKDNWQFIQERLGTFSFTPGVRYYYNQKKASGFYNELYFRYRNDQGDYLHVPGSSTKNFSTVFNENMFIIGLSSGIQIIKKDNMVIDFWILGFGYAQTSFQASSIYEDSYYNEPLDDNVRENLEAVMKNAYGSDGTTSWNNNSATYKMKKAFIPFRGFGFNVGINF